MILVYILGAAFAGALLYVWSLTSDTFTAYCIREAVLWAQGKLQKLVARFRGPK